MDLEQVLPYTFNRGLATCSYEEAACRLGESHD